MEIVSYIHHIAIAVHSISQVREFYEDALGLKITRIEEIPQRGIKTAFIQLGQSQLELIEPLNESSEVSKFLKKRGPGIHHIALKTQDIERTQEQIKDKAKLVFDAWQKGAHETKVNFLHPSSTGGVLLELVE